MKELRQIFLEGVCRIHMGLVPLHATSVADWPVNKGMLKLCSSIKTNVYEKLCHQNREENSLSLEDQKKCALSTLSLIFCSAGILIEFENVWSQHMFHVASDLYSGI